MEKNEYINLVNNEIGSGKNKHKNNLLNRV